MDLGLVGKAAVVTAASQGIAEELAKAMAATGAFAASVIFAAEDAHAMNNGCCVIVW
jgi:short-subunit dehydrogenase